MPKCIDNVCNLKFLKHPFVKTGAFSEVFGDWIPLMIYVFQFNLFSFRCCWVEIQEKVIFGLHGKSSLEFVSSNELL